MNKSTSQTIKTRRDWVVLHRGKGVAFGRSRPKKYLEGLYPANKGYRVVRAELRYPVKGKGRKDNA